MPSFDATTQRRFHAAEPTHHPRTRRMPSPAELQTRIERLYVAFVSFALGAAGTALGFTFGVVPYFRAVDLGKYDLFFTGCVAAGASIGFALGLIFGARWYRAAEPSSSNQRRMLAYLRHRGVDGRGVPHRTIAGLMARRSRSSISPST